jgi:putative sigma-54 modulation protein
VTRHFDQVVDINVLLSVEKLKEKERRRRPRSPAREGKDIFVENAHEDLYAAIDQLMDKLDRQVCRHKDRLNDHHHVAPSASTASRCERFVRTRIQAAFGPLFAAFARPREGGVPRRCCVAAAKCTICHLGAPRAFPASHVV